MILLKLVESLLRLEKGILWKSTKAPGLLLQSRSFCRMRKPLLQVRLLQPSIVNCSSFVTWNSLPIATKTKSNVNVIHKRLPDLKTGNMMQQYYDYTSDQFPGLDQAETGYDQQLPSAVLKLRGLPWTSTMTDIIEFFGSSVNIANGNDGIHLISTPEGRATGEAYVEVTTEKDIIEGLKKNKNSMGSRYIEVFKAKRAEMEWILRKNNPAYGDATGVGVGYPGLPLGGGYTYGGTAGTEEAAAYASPEIPNPFTNLTAEECETFVRLRGLPFECSSNDIFQFFKGLEVDPNGIHMVDDGSGRNTGEAYIQLTSKEDAEKALEFDRQCIGHRYIEVFRVGPSELRNYSSTVSKRARSQARQARPGPYDRPRERGRAGRYAQYADESYSGERQARYFSQRERAYDDMYTSYADSGNPLDPPPPPPPPLIPGLKSHMGANGYEGYGGDNSKNWVLMRGLPFKSTENDILEFFQPLAPASVHIIYDASGRPSGTAKVVFASPEDVNAAMGKHKNLMEHRYIELFPGGL